MGYFIGIDGGGTGCRVAVADPSGKQLGRAEGGAANIATDLARAQANILETTARAFDAAGVHRSRMGSSSAVLGLAGANLQDARMRLLANLPFARQRVVSDGETTLVGAIGPEDGVIGALGTGSVYASQTGGVFRQLGGWGFQLGDDGSGARLGRDMLHRAILAHDSIVPHSPLTREIMAEYQGSPRALVDAARGFSPKDFGQFAPRIVAAADANDANAEAIMAQHTALVRKSLNAAGFAPTRAFCMLGGLGPIFLARLPERYRSAARTPRGTALDGAVAMAVLAFA